MLRHLLGLVLVALRNSHAHGVFTIHTADGRTITRQF